MRLRKEWGEIKPSAALGGSRGLTSRTSTGDINRQIRSLVPGQTLRGEIISRSGNDVQIRLGDDTVLQAKIDQNMNLEVGKSMTFEVRNNGSALTLSPLFENTSADVNVLKALDMAGLPVNETSVAMTSQMMKAGLSVDRNSLQQVFRELAAFPRAEVSDVVNLHRLGLPVNDANINQMISYRNLTHQLLGGMEAVFDALPEAMEGMLAEGNLQGLSALYQELFDILQNGQGTLMQQEAAELSGETMQEGNTEAAETQVIGENDDGLIGQPQTELSVGATPQAAAEILMDELSGSQGGDGASISAQTEGGIQTAVPGSTESTSDGLQAMSRMLLSDQLLSVLTKLPLSTEEAAAISAQLRQFAQGTLNPEQFFAVAGRMLTAAQTAQDGIRSLHQIFAGREFHELLEGQIKNLWMMKPEEFDDPGKVENLYRRLDRQLKGLTQVLENGGQTEGTAYRAVTSMSQNIDFINQLNQMYTYVQLPLKMSDSEAHGELYVFTNKKGLASKEGKISALLHLDMEHLGPLDVYVVMEQSKVNTRFYVQDDEMLDFLEAHMDILTKRLADRGYDCSVTMSTRDDAQGENSGVAPLLSQERGIMLSQYAFDMRA